MPDPGAEALAKAARGGRLPALCVAVPPVVVALVFAISGVAALVSGRPLIWAPREITLAEAVGWRDQGEIIRQIMLGADPNRRYEVREVFREDELVVLTPLEAAVITREDYMIDLVVSYGGVIDEGNAAVLQCLAAGVDAPAVREYVLERSREFDCSDVPLPWQP